MSENNENSKDPVRIVYHAGDRTFARLFNERSLEEVKSVVRRKLGLAGKADVSLKQMGTNALLDLEDDDDFEAFRALLKSRISVDIQVTVGSSQGPTMQPAVGSQSRERPSVSQPTTISVGSLSTKPAQTHDESKGKTKEHPTVNFPPTKRVSESSSSSSSTPSPSLKPTDPAPSGQPSVKQPRKSVSKVPENQAVPKKRKASVGDAAAAASEKLGAGILASTPVASKGVEQPPRKKQKKEIIKETDTKATEAGHPPTTIVGGDEPPKKKQESTKKKDAKVTEVTEHSLTKTSDAPKTGKKKSAALDPGSKAGTSAAKDTETSQPPTKKQKKQKKDGDTASKKSSATIKTTSGADKSSNQPSNPANDAPLPSGSGVKLKDASETEGIRIVPKGTVCASIPQTSASVNVRSEVAAAILSLSRASEPMPSEPPAKRRPAKKDIKKSSSSSALPERAMSVVDVPVKSAPNIPADGRPANANQTSGLPQQVPEVNGPPCPICLETPFHIRYCCPTVLKGPDAIQERLEELKKTDTAAQQSLIEELVGLLEKAIFGDFQDATPTNGDESREGSTPSNAVHSGTPNSPRLSEVGIGGRDEGSRSESSDDTSESEIEPKHLLVPQRQRTPDVQPLPTNDDLEAVIRGPASRPLSILRVLSRIAGSEDEKSSDSEEDEAELEEDPDEETGPSRGRRLSRHAPRSSDSESEEERSGSPSPSRSIGRASNNMGPAIRGSIQPQKETPNHPDGDVVMKESVVPQISEGLGGESGEETHVGSEERMVIEELVGGKDGAVIAEEQPLSLAPKDIVPSPGASINEPQRSEKAEAGPTADLTGGVPSFPEDPVEPDVDPIEPADDMEPPVVSPSLNIDPIEAPEDIATLFTDVTQPTPKPGVMKRIKTRNGQIPDDKAEDPVLVEQLASDVANEVTPSQTKRKPPRRKDVETPVSQKPMSTRRSPRFSSLPPSTSTPAAVVLLNRRTRSGARVNNTDKTPTNRAEERSDASQRNGKHGNTQNTARLAQTPSLDKWETLAEPSSPSLQPDEPLGHVDELRSSSPMPEDNSIPGLLNGAGKKGPPRKLASSITRRKERLFDLSSSQIPFPYSQYQNDPVPAPPNEEVPETSDSEEEPKATQKKAKLPARYRSLSQLAAQATLFSPSLPTPANKSVTNGKAKKRLVDEDSSSSSSSDTDGANGSGHIPRDRRAGSALRTKKGLLSGI